MMTETRAAVLMEAGTDWIISDLGIAPPRTGEVVLRMAYAGMCHSDDHLRYANPAGTYPIVGGHEGSAVVEEVGAGVVGLRVGDHVVTSFIPSCGRCKFCLTGRSNLCDLGATISTGELPAGGFRFSLNGQDLGGFCVLGTFSQYAVVSQYSCVKIAPDIPMDVAALVSCGVPTGWGSAVYSAGVAPGETVVILGCGGIGANAVQGAVHAGASHVIVVDPVDFKRQFARSLGATHTVESAQEAGDLARQLSRGTGADATIIATGSLTSADISSAVASTGKGGVIVLTAIADDATAINVQLSAGYLTAYGIRLQGALFGSCNPHYDIPNLLRMYSEGQLKLHELITRRYSLDQVVEGYLDQREGRIIRGVIDLEASS